MTEKLPKPMPAEIIQGRAEKAFRFLIRGRRPVPEPTLDGVVDALIEGLSYEAPRPIAGRNEKLDSGKLAPLLVGNEVRSFSIDVLGLLREQATDSVPMLTEIVHTEDTRLATAAGIALERITGKPYEP